jgi:hypothetical protein
LKLIFCKECYDVVRLTEKERTCECKKSSGKYVDDLNAEISGPCIPLGFDNFSFSDAVRNQPEKSGWGKQFTAFVIPKKCNTIKVK